MSLTEYLQHRVNGPIYPIEKDVVVGLVAGDVLHDLENLWSKNSTKMSRPQITKVFCDLSYRIEFDIIYPKNQRDLVEVDIGTLYGNYAVQHTDYSDMGRKSRRKTLRQEISSVLKEYGIFSYSWCHKTDVGEPHHRTIKKPFDPNLD